MISILVVCTGNVCRSPVAEGFLRDSFPTRSGDGSIRVSSAGIAALDGYPASEGSVITAAERGVDISRHVARSLTVPMLGADLIVGMAADHRDAIDVLDPEAAARTFTLKELVRLLEALDPATPGEDVESLRHRVAQADALRRSGFVANPGDESVADPIGLPLATYRAVAWELDVWTERLVAGLYAEPGGAATTDDEDESRGAVG